MSDEKVVQFQRRPAPEAPKKVRVLECRCGNDERFRLYETGEVRCLVCDSISNVCRVYDPRKPPP